MKINYHNRKFKPVSASSGSELGEDIIFYYKQEKGILRCHYSSANIIAGNLLGIVHENGLIDMRYQQIDKAGNFMTGKCISTPEILPSGKIRLHEKWQWTSGKEGSGETVLDEV